MMEQRHENGNSRELTSSTTKQEEEQALLERQELTTNGITVSKKPHFIFSKKNHQVGIKYLSI